ncbi:hypothetical protein BGW38_010907 [Lunasporangiospora selenospora]|uniref:Membrane protein YadS n=1 Tax=Lunasporangiospora selenospora TaxID=979761 RepID=A0A9P6KF76_9FUNG|nr:hypothetical protein BGW38_010907 [Lunasporangiospora selenospora]
MPTLHCVFQSSDPESPTFKASKLNAASRIPSLMDTELSDLALSRKPSNKHVPVTEDELDLPGYKEPSSQNCLGRTRAFLQRHPWLMGWNHEDWWPCWIGLFLFFLVSVSVHYSIEGAHFQPWTSNPFDSLHTRPNLGLIVLAPLQGLLVFLAVYATGAKNWREFYKGFMVIYALSFLSKWLASQKNIKSASIGDSIWAILFGTLLRNIMTGGSTPSTSGTTPGAAAQSRPLPGWLKVAQQTELYIAISLVLLCIDVAVLRPLAPRALFVSWVDTPTLFIFVAIMGSAWLRIDLQTAIIMSGATFICGSSAAIALSSSLAAGSKADLPIAIISVFTIPSIIALPYIAKAIGISAQVAGAWFGGCIDSTGAVIAAAAIYGDPGNVAVETSAVVKMVQNVLIGPISVGVAVAWTHREQRRRRAMRSSVPEELTERDTTIDNNDSSDAVRGRLSRTESSLSSLKPIPYRTLLWQRFPKFVLGFIMTAVLFNTVVPLKDRPKVNSFSFMVGEWFSTMSFVSIGLGLQFHELRREARMLLKLTTLYAAAQLVDILSTFGLAYVAFELF